MVFIIPAGAMVVAALFMRAGVITDEENAKEYRIASNIALIINGHMII